MSGAASATMTNRTRITRPKTARRLRRTVSAVVRSRDRWATAPTVVSAAGSVISDSRVQPGVQQVDDQVDHEKHRGDVEHRSLEDGEVPVPHCQVGEPPDAGPGEDDLHHHHAAEEEAELEADDGDDGDPGVGEDVVEEHGAAAEPFGSSHP